MAAVKDSSAPPGLGAANLGSGLTVENVSYVAKDKKDKKSMVRLLDGVSFNAPRGEVAAILGPSGAGKSLLLDTLAFSVNSKGATAKKTQPRAEGTVHFDGQALKGHADFQSIGTDGVNGVYIPNSDVQFPTLTVNQTLLYNAKMIGSPDPQAAVDKVVSQMGLDVCKHGKVGGYVGMKGISGGQKKRLALAQGLLRCPKLLLLDEPTSGLDSAAAVHVMRYLKDLAVANDIAVVCSLQQPSEEVLESVSRVLLLSGGRQAFFGAPTQVTPHLEAVPLRKVVTQKVLDDCRVRTMDGAAARKEKISQQLAALAEDGASVTDTSTEDSSKAGGLRNDKRTRTTASSAASGLKAELRVVEATLQNGVTDAEALKMLLPAIADAGSIQHTAVDKRLQTVDFRLKCPNDTSAGSDTAALSSGEFSLQAINADFTDAEGVVQILDHWATHQAAAQASGSIACITAATNSANGGTAVAKKTAETVLQRPAPPSWMSQFAAVLGRDVAVVLSDPLVYLARCAIFFITGFMMVLIFWEGREYTNEYLFSRMWPVLMANTAATQMGLITVYFSHRSNSVFEAEIKNGFYTSGQLLLAQNILLFPGCALMSLCALLGNLYGFGNFRFEQSFPSWFLLYFLILALFDSAARLFTVLPPNRSNVMMGFMSYIQYWFSSFLFCGFMIDNDKVEWPFKLMTYISPHRWTMPPLFYYDFGAANWDADAVPCAAGTIVSPRLHLVKPEDEFCHFHGGLAASTDGTGAAVFRGVGDGFRCTKETAENNFKCYGYTGEQVLQSLKKSFPIIETDSDNTALCFGVLFAILLGQMIFHAYFFATGVKPSCKFGAPSAVGRLVISNEASDKQRAEGSTGSKAGPACVVMGEKDFLDKFGTALVASPSTGGPSAGSAALQLQAGAGGRVAAPAAPLKLRLRVQNVVCRAQVKKGKGDKKKDGAKQCGKVFRNIVDDVSLDVRSGEIMAVLGPSGAGKTTLLNSITFNNATDLKTAGSVWLQTLSQEDDKAVDQSFQIKSLKQFSDYCTYVPQHDRYFGMLTCREMLETVAGFLHDRSTQAGKEAIAREVDEVLDLLGLTSCASVKCDDMLSGEKLSNGQKKRLSVGCALLKRPQILFCDEPTTGLDAASALAVSRALERIARHRQIIVLVTIHQPALEVWNLFDKILLMARGRTAYNGGRVAMNQHFFSGDSLLGLTEAQLSKAESNPSQFYLDLVNNDFTSEESLDKILTHWDSAQEQCALRRTKSEQEDAAKLTSADDNTRMSKPSSLALKPKSPSVSDFAIIRELFKREVTVTVTRDVVCYWGRFVCYFLSSMFFCLVYVDYRNYELGSEQGRMFLLMWVLGSQLVFCVCALTTFGENFLLAKTEMRNGFYKPWQYNVAQTLVCVPMQFVLGVAPLLGNIFGVAGFDMEVFGIFYLNYVIGHMAFEFVAHAMGTSNPNQMMGMLNFVNYWFSAFLFCGMLLDVDECIYPFRIIAYMYPFRYILANAQYIDHAWVEKTVEGTKSCPSIASLTGSADQIDTQRMTLQTQEGCMWPNGDDKPGYSCGANYFKTPCYGHTGTEVLISLNRQFSAVSEENHVWLYIGVLAIFAAVHKIGHWVVVATQAMKSATLLAAPPALPKGAVLEGATGNGSRSGGDADNSKHSSPVTPTGGLDAKAKGADDSAFPAGVIEIEVASPAVERDL